MTTSCPLRSSHAVSLKSNYVAIGEVWIWQFIGNLALMDGNWARAIPSINTCTASRPWCRREWTRGGGAEVSRWALVACARRGQWRFFPPLTDLHADPACLIQGWWYKSVANKSFTSSQTAVLDARPLESWYCSQCLLQFLTHSSLVFPFVHLPEKRKGCKQRTHPSCLEQKVAWKLEGHLLEIPWRPIQCAERAPA